MSNINDKSREDLKGYFLRDTIPTEENFAALIDAAIIQGEDPIAIVPGNPLMIKTAGDTSIRQELIRFYDNFDGDPSTPSWILGQNPAGGAEGLEIATPDSTQLFIGVDGNVGLGTVNPAEKLEVTGNIQTTGTFNNGNLTINGSGITTATGTLTLQETGGSNTMLINNTAVSIGQEGNTRTLNLWGNMVVNGTPVNFNQQANNNQIVKFMSDKLLIDSSTPSNDDRKGEHSENPITDTLTFIFEDLSTIDSAQATLQGWRLDHHGDNDQEDHNFNEGWVIITGSEIQNSNQVIVSIECYLRDDSENIWRAESHVAVIAVGSPAVP